MDMNEMNRKVIEEFRANHGKVGGRFEAYPLLLLKTIGAKTGEPRTKPLAYLADGERYIIIASFAGAAASPPWFFNLKKNPDVEVEVGDEKFAALATIIDEPERSEIYQRVVAAMPIFAEYQEKTTRVIPVVSLTRAG